MKLDNKKIIFVSLFRVAYFSCYVIDGDMNKDGRLRHTFQVHMSITYKICINLHFLL